MPTFCTRCEHISNFHCRFARVLTAIEVLPGLVDLVRWSVLVDGDVLSESLVELLDLEGEDVLGWSWNVEIQLCMASTRAVSRLTVRQLGEDGVGRTSARVQVEAGADEEDVEESLNDEDGEDGALSPG